jgi:predicted DNA-binding protein YlxM (UPF0122 family)
MNNIFADINGRSPIEVYEDTFIKHTGIDYKDYLYDQYIMQDVSQLIIAETLGTNRTKIHKHLEYYNIKKEVKDHDGKYNKTIGMIEKETGRKFVDIYNELKEQSLTDTEIATQLKLKNVSAISAHIYALKRQEERKVNTDKLIVQGLSGKHPKVVEKMFKEQTGMDIKDWLKEKYIDEGLSLEDIADLIGMSPRRLSDKVRYYKLIKTPSQARQNAMERGTINYKEISKKARISRIKHGAGSNSQDMFRELIKHHLVTKLDDFKGIEIITGYNEYGVLDTLEIDIPIIIFYNNKILKLAIEYDGDYWHNNEDDLIKEELLNKRNWQLIRIVETKKDAGKLYILEDKAKELANLIVDKIRSL